MSEGVLDFIARNGAAASSWIDNATAPEGVEDPSDYGPWTSQGPAERMLSCVFSERYFREASQYGEPIPEDTPRLVQMSMWFTACHLWLNGGRQRYRLTDSLAACLMMTSAPPFTGEFLPHDAFTMEVPSRFCPVDSAAMTTVLVSSNDMCTGVHVFGSDLDRRLGFSWKRGEPIDPEALDLPDNGLMRGVLRLVSNTVCFMESIQKTASRTPRSGSAGAGKVVTLAPPRDVVVTRELRAAAAALATASTFAGVRRAMTHFVRGHWRNQPCGEGRQEIRRTWVRPHKRGDESLGRVVERITKLTEAP